MEFLKRIPDAPIPPDAAANSPQPVPWMELAAFPPFRKLLWTNVIWSFAVGGQVAFTAAYLRGMGKMTEGAILIISSVFFVGGLVSLIVGRQLDRMGSRPALTVSCMLWIFIVLVWMLIAGGIVPLTLQVVLALQFLMGFSNSTFNMANVRLAMVISPPMGKTHFFAIFSVVANLTLGLAPVLWGLLIDVFSATNISVQSFTFNRYSIFYLGTVLFFFATLLLTRRLEEPAAARVQELIREIVLTSPQRFWARMFTRL